MSVEIKMLFDWAEREEYIKRNPARDIKALGNDTAAKDARDPFTSEELKRIFSAPLYSGCRSDRGGYPAHPRSVLPAAGGGGGCSNEVMSGGNWEN